ncbi:type II secretion system F family protein [Thermosediminibacter oceani]|uniref:Type II secretion system F domain protein n=1 Tax=Thermosediminibacter oceani (strain ATCC BAA-1034 / DSM 16646 / JW/IW-1228P) TaxID=555079 RepID=D9RXL6_THEOJ|nr:type II secretion system F family protein [Thermosediminibacter oceani]ADL08090.1 Type II secretion system F domain protein [Thermosediminibacter oceani DSM 16646]
MQDVANLLKNKGFFPVRIRKEPLYTLFFLYRDFMLKRGFRELAVFCRQMASMLESGIPVIECLSVMCQQNSHPGLTRALRRVIRDLKRGFTLSEAFRNQPGIFPEILIYTVETGEIAGCLEDILKKLAVHFETMAKYRERLKTSMTYPAILGAVALVVFYYTSNNILPVYSNMFEESGVYLPVITRIFMSVSTNMGRYVLYSLSAFFLLLLGLYKLKRDPEKAYAIDKFWLSTPVLGPLQKKSTSAILCRVLAILISCGIPLVKAIEIVESAQKNQVFKRDLQVALENLRIGKNLAVSLRDSSFPPLMLKMLQVGIESGKLEEMLFKTADFYDSEVEDMQSRLLSIAGPAALILMSLIIGFAVISIVLPMFNIYSSF